MSAWADDPDHFARFVEAEGGTKFDFVQRRQFGRYLRDQLSEAQANGASVIEGNAVRARPTDGGWSVGLESGESVAASVLVLALGNQPPEPLHALAGAGPGNVAWAVVAIVLSNVFFTYGESLIAAFLPELACEDSLGRVSGWGWSFGYFGGMLTLGLSLGYVSWAQGQGLPASHFVPVTMLITAGVFALATLPTFALLDERVHKKGYGKLLLETLPPATRSEALDDVARFWSRHTSSANVPF